MSWKTLQLFIFLEMLVMYVVLWVGGAPNAHGKLKRNTKPVGSKVDQRPSRERNYASYLAINVCYIS